jgi:16S rRNA (guanine527-N7)-methyltransferase
MVETRTVSVISARAFAPLDKLLKISARFSTRDTLWLLPKGRSAGQEFPELKKSVREGFHVEQSLTDEEAGLIVGHLNPKVKP